MNCISWIIGHLANQENAYWVLVAQGQKLVPGLNDLVGFGKPASTPPLPEMWAAWRTITTAADAYLDTLTPELLQTHLMWRASRGREHRHHAAAQYVPLLVPHRRGARHPADAGTHRTARVRRGHVGGGLSARGSECQEAEGTPSRHPVPNLQQPGVLDAHDAPIQPDPTRGARRCRGRQPPTAGARRFIRQLGAGIFSYLPLARRSLTKIENILREEMDRSAARR